MMPLDGDPRPFPKTTQLARQERRYRRKVASPARWQRIADAKQGPCRVCHRSGLCELHHIVARAQGGADTESNIAPLCGTCHQLVTLRNRTACEAFVLSLDDAEYAYAVDVAGEAVWERGYGIVYARAAR